MNIALILSGGTGMRLGSEIPKQYIKVRNRMLIDYCIETLVMHEGIDAIQIVADKNWMEPIKEELRKQNIQTSKIKGFSKPGKNRQQSILNGLEDIRKYANDDSYVLVHDAARPMLSKQLITDCIQAVKGHDGVMPVLPVKDTMYMTSENGKRIDQLLDRSRLVAGQAPELFHLGKYYSANINMNAQEMDCVRGSSEPAFMAGMDIALIPGEESNFKITTMQDLKQFEKMQG